MIDQETYEKMVEDRRRAYIKSRAILGERLMHALKNAQIAADCYRDPDTPARLDAMADLADVMREIVTDSIADQLQDKS